MKNSLVGILNGANERVQNVKSIVRKLPSYTKISILTRTPDEFTSFPNVKCIELTGELDGNIARCKNVFLKEALELGSEFCYIMEDNFSFDSWRSLLNYQGPMRAMDYPIAAFGGYYTKGRNMVLGKRVNPALKMRFGTETLVFNRVINTSLIVHRMEPDTQLYDENLGLVEFEEYSLRLKEKNKIPMFSLYLDVNNAENYFSESDSVVYRKKTKEMYEADGKTVGNRIHVEGSFDPLISYCVKKAVEKGMIPNA